MKFETSKGHLYDGSASSEGVPHGQGTMRYKSGEVYVGEWKKGERCGKGDMVYADGLSRYVGEFARSKKEGFGKMSYANGDSYEGEWREGQFEGKGVYRFHQGESFEGSYSKNRRARGKYSYASDGSYYEGDFACHMNEDRVYEDVFHGKGTFFYREGEVYAGEWREGLRHGDATYEWPSGSKFKGQFVDDEMVHGFYKTASGNEYLGDFMNGLRHGKGKAKFKKNGGSYDGEYQNDTMHGKGTYHFGCGSVFEGSYSNNVRHGYGTLKNANGEIVLKGTFENGTLLLPSTPRNNTKVRPTADNLNQQEDITKPGLEQVASRRNVRN